MVRRCVTFRQIEKGRSGVFQPSNSATQQPIFVEIVVDIVIEWMNFNVLLAILVIA